jgi:hypothetical protein
MKVIQYDNMHVRSLTEACVAPKSSKGIVERPFRYISSRWLTLLRRMTVTQDESGTMACDVVVAAAEGSRCPVISRASSPASVSPGAGIKRGGRADRGARGGRGARGA